MPFEQSPEASSPNSEYTHSVIKIKETEKTSLKIKVLKTDEEGIQVGKIDLSSKSKVHGIIPKADEESLIGAKAKILADEEPPKQSQTSTLDRMP